MYLEEMKSKQVKKNTHLSLLLPHAGTAYFTIKTTLKYTLRFCKTLLEHQNTSQFWALQGVNIQEGSAVSVVGTHAKKIGTD